MLTCIACSKQLNNGSLHQRERQEDDDDAMETPRTKQAIKAITAQVFTYLSVCLLRKSSKKRGTGK